MHSPAPALLEATGRIWNQVRDKTSSIGDLFERIAESFYAKLISPGDTVIDGGAHVGRHTIPLAHLVGPYGLVVAFEPLPSPAAKLTQLLADAGLSERVQLRRDALAHVPGRQDFFVVNNMLEYSGLRSREYVDFVADETKIQVDVTTIDLALDACGVRGAVPFVKLDLESGEFRALQGAERSLRAWQPCCVFENGLQSSAQGYDVTEFFNYFRSIGYELFDILGSPVVESLWSRTGPWYFVAMSQTRTPELLPLLWASALEELLASPWLLSKPLGPAPMSFAVPQEAGSRRVIGYMDQVEASIRIAGWAADVKSGRPARSLVIAVDGVAVASASPDIPRHDVVAETGQLGFERSGFDVTVRTKPAQRVEVFAEGGDSAFRLLGTATAPSVNGSTSVALRNGLRSSWKTLVRRVSSWAERDLRH